MAVRMEYRIVMPPAPNISGFLRPMKSRTSVMKLKQLVSIGLFVSIDGKTHKKLAMGPTAP